jgi:enoyl-CoA hydratase
VTTGRETKRAIHAAVEVIRRGPVAEVIIGDGARHNVLGSAGWIALARTFRELAADDTIRAVVLAGRGDSFCAGSDVREWDRAAAVEAAFAQMEAACAAIEDLPVPVVAKVTGVAGGAGCQLALARDLRVSGRRALIGMPIARFGILASPSFAARLSLLAGPGAARDLLYTGRLIGSAEAARLGLVTRLVRRQGSTSPPTPWSRRSSPTRRLRSGPLSPPSERVWSPPSKPRASLRLATPSTTATSARESRFPAQQAACRLTVVQATLRRTPW